MRKPVDCTNHTPSTIREIQSTRKMTPTTVRLSVPKSRHRYLLLMLDIGASINMIKKGALKDGIPLEEKSAKIAGITPDTMHTLGSVMLTIRGQPYHFHVVDDDFSIRDGELIGRNLFSIRNDVMNPILFLTADERHYHLATRSVPTNAAQVLRSSKTNTNNSTASPPIAPGGEYTLDYNPQISTPNENNVNVLRICSWNINGLCANIAQEGF